MEAKLRSLWREPNEPEIVQRARNRGSTEIGSQRARNRVSTSPKSCLLNEPEIVSQRGVSTSPKSCLNDSTSPKSRLNEPEIVSQREEAVGARPGDGRTQLDDDDDSEEVAEVRPGDRQQPDDKMTTSEVAEDRPRDVPTQQEECCNRHRCCNRHGASRLTDNRHAPTSSITY